MAYKTDEELKSQIKLWFKDYGKFLLTAILLGVLLVGGWNIWQRYQTERIVKATALYEKLMDKYISPEYQGTRNTGKMADLTENSLKEIKAITHQLKTDYSFTHYSFFAAMLLAKQYSQQSDYQQAAAELQWTLNHSEDSALNALVRLRLAEILWQQQKTDEARNLLSQEVPLTFAALYQELLGDIALSTDNQKAARLAYQNALRMAEQQDSSNTAQIRNLRNKVDFVSDVE